MKKRTIKFRAWDGMMRKMWYPETLSNDGSDTFYAFYNDKKKTIGWGLYDRKLENRLVSGAYEDSFLMQFTGSFDRNGKEIYEGDIVNVPIGKREIMHKGVIEWEEYGWIVSLKGSDWYEIVPEVEVIGNIYENPELIGNVAAIA